MGEDQAIDRLREILARPEYQVDQTLPWWQQLLAPLLDFVWSLISQLIQMVLASMTGREGPIGASVLVVCLALLVGVGVYLARAARLSILRDRQLRTASLTERRERSDQLWRAAEELAAAGRLSDAVRLAYLSALYALDERMLLHIESNLTNREHAERLKQQHPSIGQGFTDLVERYDRIRYGQLSVAADGFAEFSGHAQRVRVAALEGATA
jgi:hypothetical protein